MNRPISATGTIARPLLALLLAGLVGACTTLGAAGPSSGQIRKAEGTDYAGSQVALVDLDPLTYKRIAAFEQSLGLAQQFGEGGAGEVLIGPGDVLDIAMWEAPPAVLFGGGGVILWLDAGAQNRTVVQQVVDGTGMISVPFAGLIEAAGQTPAAIERAIVARLAGRANDPQVNVRLSLNDLRNVTVLGEIAASRRVPLGPRGERLLDIIASAGGPRAPVHQTTVQVSRGGTSATMALEAIIAQPAQNIRMRPEDVVTVLHQPYSFIAMGAVATSAEIPFEGRGICWRRPWRGSAGYATTKPISAACLCSDLSNQRRWTQHSVWQRKRSRMAEFRSSIGLICQTPAGSSWRRNSRSAIRMWSMYRRHRERSCGNSCRP